MWPYFGSSASRVAMKRSRPVSVTSCWNSMVFIPAESFVGEQAIVFRGLDDTLAAQHLEGSECCLIHTDNPVSAKWVLHQADGSDHVCEKLLLFFLS
ncbi:cryptococcal mannosyltransferase 1-domain-containing protein [Dactylonectria estremocensis]|uniref:Cryptococcal mannosyltransferase 1-domain-containing protein n=1 Tax=Dactylonectria estremocensis TaxID=1079267 RepID=A0A9P9J2V6_9HYPO|nr:cryptococcal mannosyltransferase 1-domain-containing protein [Dactylonectria estremocensis]